jgi:hypothetical protein
MRRDMAKIIVERPRYRLPTGWTRGRGRSDEDGLQREGMTRRYKANELKKRAVISSTVRRPAC